MVETPHKVNELTKSLGYDYAVFWEEFEGKNVFVAMKESHKHGGKYGLPTLIASSDDDVSVLERDDVFRFFNYLKTKS